MKDIEALREIFPLVQIFLTLVLLLGYFLVKKILSNRVLKRANKHDFDETRSQYIRKAIRMGLRLIVFITLGVVWEISLKGLSVYIASIFTVVGVGLFATWSIVSNITASVILFFFFPFKIGSKVKIVDGDNSAEGTVIDLSLFSIKIQREDGKEIYFPNNLAMQKSIIHLD